jgi:hypothetical protein
VGYRCAFGAAEPTELDLGALEVTVRRQALQFAGCAVQQRLNADHTDQDASQARCGSGQMARYTGRREKAFERVLEPLKLQRAYFHWAACGQGFCPRDRQLGLENTSPSPAVTRMMAAVGAYRDEHESEPVTDAVSNAR